jgi:hypothetical protein
VIARKHGDAKQALDCLALECLETFQVIFGHRGFLFGT